MTWIVLSIILLICAWAGAGMWYYARGKENVTGETAVSSSLGFRFPTRAVGIGIVVSCAVLWLVITGFAIAHNVGQREVAIVYNFSGTISGKRDPGTVFIKPWEHIKKENVGIQHIEYDFGQNNSAVSRDQQKIFAKLAVNFQIDSVNVVDLYKRVGPSWKDIIIEARVPQVFKEVTATFQTPRITEERAELREQTRERLIKELDQYDIKVIDVFITNLGFSEQYSQAIEEKQQQVQDAQRAEAKVKQVEAEARQKVAEAEGEAKSNIARARGEARANKLRSRSLTPAILKLRAIETLNDNVQIIVCPPKSVCIPNSTVVPEP